MNMHVEIQAIYVSFHPMTKTQYLHRIINPLSLRLLIKPLSLYQMIRLALTIISPRLQLLILTNQSSSSQSISNTIQLSSSIGHILIISPSNQWLHCAQSSINPTSNHRTDP
jgi:hypothetical protein